MQFSLSNFSSYIKTFAPRLGCAVVFLSLLPAQIARAEESVYIEQATGGAGAPKLLLLGTNPNSQSGGSAHTNSSSAPEFVSPPHSGNLAGSLTVGSFNNIAQIQAGQSDTSAVSILGGTHDNVSVLQAGNNDVSNIALIGVQGINIGVVQGPHARPINLIIARLPNGSITIRR
jgi:hypothetical protein